MKKLGAQLTPASGALQGCKGDGTLEGGDYQFRLENKATIHNSLSIKLDWLAKITGEASNTNHVPALAFQFVHGAGSPKRDGEWVAIPAWLFKEVFGQ